MVTLNEKESVPCRNWRGGLKPTLAEALAPIKDRAPVLNAIEFGIETASVVKSSTKAPGGETWSIVQTWRSSVELE